MNEYLTVLALAALPAAGNFAGGLFAEFVSVSDRLLSLALHAAAGIVLGVVGIELMEQVLQAEPPWVPLLAFVTGGGAGGACYLRPPLRSLSSSPPRSATGPSVTPPTSISSPCWRSRPASS